MTETGTRVEHLATDRTVGHQLLHRRLRTADVPWNRSVDVLGFRVHRFETGDTGFNCHGLLASWLVPTEHTVPESNTTDINGLISLIIYRSMAAVAAAGQSRR